jgi:peptide/nickel transport system substrate-binding protein
VISGNLAAFREIHFTIHGDGKPWDDVRVRQAINFATDRQKIIDNVYAGAASFSSKIPAHFGDWPIPEDELKSNYEKYDLAKAKQLMKDAGYENGFKVTLTALSNPQDYVLVAQVLKEQLKLINIDVTVQPQELGTFGTNDGKGNFEWDATGRGMRGDPSGYFADFDPAGSIDKAWFSGGYNNDTMTSLISQGLAETDPVKRKQIYTQLQQIVLTEWPTMPLVVITKFEAVGKHVNGMNVTADDTYRTLAEVWLS